METLITGLSCAEAQRRLEQFGPNATPDVSVHPLRLILSKFLAPVSVLLEIAIVFQLALGEYIEAAIIGTLLLFNSAIGFFHENRAQSTIAALKSGLALRASVLRDGLWTVLPAAELVPGDIVKLSLGTVVAADVRIREGSILLDQSVLTGESLPVEAGPSAETYAGALVQRGEAIAEVLATGVRTKFGRTAELVRTAYVVSTQQKAVFRVVRNLAGFNGAVTLLVMVYAYHIGMPMAEAIPLVLIAVLGSVPVALPATFTLATAIGAQALTRVGVLPTRLSAVDEAASLDVLCIDKTGTLTRNELAVAAVHAMPGFDQGYVLALAALASGEGGRDPVDTAVRAAAVLRQTNLPRTDPGLPTVTSFTPFDPATKMSEARAVDHDGNALRIVKGAFAVVLGLSQPAPAAELVANELEKHGHRVLGVAIGSEHVMRVAGLVALSDPPRSDSKGMIDQLRALGVHTVMVTGDAATTAAFVADAVGLTGGVCPPGGISDSLGPEDFSVYAGVLPEDKFRLVKAFQNSGHTVGMCGDGANDAPALRQAQIGIAVSSATDVAKSAAGIVLTEPGLAGIVASVREGRVTFQRILTYALRSIVQKTRQVLFLGFGLILTKHAILDACADGHFDDHRRFSFDVVNDRSCSSLTHAELLAHRSANARRHYHGILRSRVLRGHPGLWFQGDAPRYRYVTHDDVRDAHMQRPSRVLCRPRAKTSLVFAAEPVGRAFKYRGRIDRRHAGAWRNHDGAARAVGCRRHFGFRYRPCSGHGPDQSLALRPIQNGLAGHNAGLPGGQPISAVGYRTQLTRALH